MTREQLLFKRLRWAATFVISALAIQAASFLWSHPAAFLLFTLIGGSLMLLGIFLYLLAVFHPTPWAFAYRILRREPPTLSTD